MTVMIKIHVWIVFVYYSNLGLMLSAVPIEDCVYSLKENNHMKNDFVYKFIIRLKNEYLTKT